MRIPSRLKQNYFLRNIALLASGSILAQVIAVLCSPIITRLYTVDEIGIYSYLIAMVSIFTAVMNGRYDMAIVSEEEEKNVFPIIKLSILIGIIVSIVATVFFGFYFWFAKSEYASYRYAIVVFFFLLVANAFINVFNSYNNRNKEYRLMTSVYVIRTGCQNIGGVLLGIGKIGVLGLLLPYTVGQYLGMKRQAKSLLSSFKNIWASDYEAIKKVAQKHIQLPVFSVPAMFANSFSYSSVTIFMESLFDMSVVGYYSLSTRILGLPLSLISGNVSKVFFQEASIEYSNTKGFMSSYKKTILFLTAMAVPMGIIMYVFAPWACSTFFGDNWFVAGEYIRILAPYYMIRFVGTALSPGLLICKKQKQELMIQVLLVITSVISYAITVFISREVEVFLWCICITKSIIYLLLIVLIWRNAFMCNKNKIIN